MKTLSSLRKEEKPIQGKYKNRKGEGKPTKGKEGKGKPTTRPGTKAQRSERRKVAKPRAQATPQKGKRGAQKGALLENRRRNMRTS